MTAPDRPLLFSITAPNDYFVPGSIAPFTFHVFNQSDVERTATIRYGLPHHTWESGDAATYGYFHDLSQTLTVPASGEATFTWQVPVFTTDRLWAKLFEDNLEVGQAHFAVFRASASANINLGANPATWFRGNPVNVQITASSASSAPMTGTLELQITDARNQLLHADFLSLTLPATGETVLISTFTVPITVSNGSASASAYLRDSKGTIVGAGHASFDVPASPLVYVAVLPKPLAPGATQAVTVNVVNASPVITVTDANLSLALIDSQGMTTTLGSRAFGLGAGGSITFTFPITTPQPRFGDYTFVFAAVDEFGSRSWEERVTSHVVSNPRLDRPRYRIGDTLNLVVPLVNDGDFLEDLQISAEVPDAAYSDTRSAQLQPGQQTVLTYTLTVPTSIGAGSHPVTLTVLQPGGGVSSQRVDFRVPVSELRAALAQEAASVGEVVTLTVTNAGGATTSVTYELALNDLSGRAVFSATGSLASIAPGTGQPVTFSVPSGAVSGLYYVAGKTTDGQTGEVRPFALPLQVAGISAMLDAQTERETYASGEVITASTVLTNADTGITGGTLHLQIEQRTGEPQWVNHLPGDYSLADNAVYYEFAIDGAGIKWFAASSIGVSMLDDGSTPFDKSDDTWATLTPADGLGSTYVSAVAIDAAGLKWFGAYNAVSVLDDAGTPFNKSDDTWVTFTPADGLASYSVDAIAFDTAGRRWFGTNINGVSLLDDGGTPFDKSDDTWVSFTTADGLANGSIMAIAVDNHGRKWFGISTGYVSALDDGGTPFDKSDDTWVTFTLASYPVVRDVEFDVTGRKWFGTSHGVSVLDDAGTLFDMSDDTWATFTITDGLVHNEVHSIAIDTAGRKWFASSYYAGYRGGLSVLDDGGTPFDKSDDAWATFTASDSGLVSNEVNAISIDTQGQKWLGTSRGVNVLNDSGTPFNKVDDAWQTFTSGERGLISNHVRAVAIEGTGRKWFGTPDGVGVFDDSGTPSDKLDDIWGAFRTTDGLTSNAVNTIAIDAAGHKWFGTSTGRVSMLDDGGTPYDKLDDTWQTFTVTGNSITSIAIDRAGQKWFGAQFSGAVSVLNDGGTPFDTSDDTWGRFRTTDGLVNNWIQTIAIDAAGHKWFGTDGGVGVLDDGGTPFDNSDDTWGSFTTVDGLADSSVNAIVFDAMGHKWFGTYSGGVSILDDGGTPFDKADDTWASFTPDDGLASYNIFSAAIDAARRKWFGTSSGASVLDDGGTPFDKSDDTWITFINPNWLGRYLSLRAIAFDATGHKWFGIDGYGVSMLSEGTRIVWERDATMDLSPAQVTTVITSSGVLSAEGKLYLVATLTSPTGQAVASDTYPFYVFPGDTALTLNAGSLLARPGQTITLTGQVQNRGVVTLTSQTLTVTQNGALIYSAGPFDLPPGESYPYVTTTSVPTTTGNTVFDARVGEVQVKEVVQVTRPAVTTGVQAPSVAGRQPFSFTVALTNTGLLDAWVEVTIDASDSLLGTRQSQLAIPAGQARLVQDTYQIWGDTVFTVTFGGDLNQSVVVPITLGEAATVTFAPQPVYPEGAVTIPYTLTNTGQLPVEFTTAVTVTNLASGSWASTFDAYLPVSSTSSGSLLLELPAGSYTLNYATPFEAGSASFRVLPLIGVELSAAAGPNVDSVITITANLTNTGYRPLSGTLRLEAPFFSTDAPLSLAPGASVTESLSLNTAAAAPGSYTATLAVLSGSGSELLATGTLPITVAGPDMQITHVPTTTVLAVGQVHTLTFGIANLGDAAGQAALHFTLSDFEDESQTVWLEPGQSGELAFRFFLPDDLATGTHAATYALSVNGSPLTSGDVLLNVAGIDVGVEATTDAPRGAYQTGDTAGVTITVTNQSASAPPPLYALVRFNSDVVTRPLTFSPSAAVATFDVPVRFDGDAKVFYGIYQQGTDRGIHLNTIYLYEFDPALTLRTDRQVYRPGDLVQVTLVTTATGQLAISAPGYSTTLQLPTSNFQFVLPSPMARGTYEILYTLTGCDCPLEGQTRAYRFDVDAPRVRITDARVHLQSPFANLELTVAASDSLNAVLRAWILSPEGRSGQVVEQAISLSAVPNNHAGLPLPLNDAGLGPNRLVYHIVDAADPALVYSAGSEAFDVGGAALIGVRTARAEYPYTTEPVAVEASVYASAPATASLSLHLDGAPAGSEAFSLVTGTQTISLALPGPVAPAWHDLSATLNVGGLTSTQSLRFVYGMQAADLVLSEPRLSVSASGVTGTLEVFVRNAGGEAAPITVVKMWDGDPASGGTLIGQVTVPALDAGAGEWVQIAWDLAGKGGAHTLYARADALDQVTEFYEDNNTSTGQVTVPGFAVQVSADPVTVDPGQAVSITVSAVNLQSSVDVTLALTTTAEYEWSLPVFEDARSLLVTAGGQAAVTIPWDTTDALGGQYGVRVVAQSDGDQRQALTTVRVRDSANFVAYPLSGTLPLTVTFNDLSTPLGGIDAWLWDFGDGITGTLQNPTHVYSQPGIYTVTLAVTAGTDVYTKTRPAYIEVAPGIPVGDLIFADGFESGDFSAWSAAVTDGGDLSVSTAAALAPVGAYGLVAVIDDTAPIYVRDDTPANEPRYRARFYFDPNSVTLPLGEDHDIFAARTSSGVAFRVQVDFDSDVYTVQAEIRTDAGTDTASAKYAISDAPHFIEVDWQAATAAGANDGTLSLWLDGEFKQTVSGIDNDTLRVEEAWLGPSGSLNLGISGTEYFDAFASRRSTYIGPEGVAARFSASPLEGAAPLTVTFTNTSQPSTTITAYLWNFGDGYTSTLTHPVHVYTATGQYTVALTAFAGQVQDTFTRTHFITVSDTIFADGFESGDFSAWSAAVTDVGDLSVSTAAALDGTYGLQAVIDDTTPIYVRDDTPTAERRYRARFSFDPNSVTLPDGEDHDIFAGRTASTAAFRVQVTFVGGVYTVLAKIRDDAGSDTSSAEYAISDAPHFIEVDWQAASGPGANDGYLSLWIDGEFKETVSGIDNDTFRIEQARLGPSGSLNAGTTGTEYFDAFESSR